MGPRDLNRIELFWPASEPPAWLDSYLTRSTDYQHRFSSISCRYEINFLDPGYRSVDLSARPIPEILNLQIESDVLAGIRSRLMYLQCGYMPCILLVQHTDCLHYAEVHTGPVL